MKKQKNSNLVMKTTERVEDILGWPTDTFAMDWTMPTGVRRQPQPQEPDLDGDVDDGIVVDVDVHTVLIFVPGNPGLVAAWYRPFFTALLGALGPGFAVRAASHAGHSVDAIDDDARRRRVVDEPMTREDDGTTAAAVHGGGIPPKTLAWTVEGQAQHKLAYVNRVLTEEDLAENPPRLVWLGHSIGCHLLQRMLMMMMSPDDDGLLRRTTHCLYLMPFIRMDAPAPYQRFLDAVARHPTASQTLLRTVSKLARSPLLSSSSSGGEDTLAKLLSKTMDRPEDRLVTAKLVRQGQFVRTFLGLGLEEIRDVPQTFDVPGLRYISSRHGVPITLLYAGNDHWGPESHVRDLRDLLDKGVLSSRTVSVHYNPALKHDFITSVEQTAWVTAFCLDRLVRRSTTTTTAPHSRL